MGDGRNTDGEEFVPQAIAAALNRSKDVFMDLVSSDEDRNEVYTRWLSPILHYDERLKRIKRTKRYDLYEKPGNLFKVISSYMIAEKKGCEVKEDGIPVYQVPTKMVDAMKGSFYWKPSYEFESFWRQTVSEGVRVLHGGECSVLEFYVTWLEKVEDIHMPSVTDEKEYIYTDGKKYTRDTVLLLGDSAYDVILAGAEMILRRNNRDLSVTIQREINKRKIIR